MGGGGGGTWERGTFLPFLQSRLLGLLQLWQLSGARFFSEFSQEHKINERKEFHVKIEKLYVNKDHSRFRAALQ